MKKAMVLACALALSLFAAVGPALAGNLVVYTALEDDQIPTYLESFKKAHPDISVTIVRDSTGVVTAKLLAEKDNPVADVVWGTAATSLLILQGEELLEGYDPKGIERVLPEFKDSASPVRWVGIDAWMTAFVVNEIEMKSKNLPHPQSYENLLDPKYKGLVVMPNPASSGTGFLTVSAILQLFGEEKGWAYLDKLNENIAVYTHSGSAPAKLAGTGEYPIGISFGYRGIIQKRKGEPVATIFPKEGSGWELEANALIKKKEIKPEAKIFLDWAISDAAIAEYSKNFAIVSVPGIGSVPEGFPADPVKQMVRNDLVWAAESRERILDEWNKRYGMKETR
jgi:iron(III) transport system substrate-binding protein